MVSIEMAFDWTDHINILRLGSSLKGLKTYSNIKLSGTANTEYSGQIFDNDNIN